VQIEFKDVKMRYRPGLPLVLKGLNVCIEAGTTCGVVGRTGKSCSDNEYIINVYMQNRI